MDNHRIKAIIFDLGRVLVDFDHRIAARRIAEFSDRSADEIFNLFFDSEIISRFEEGRILPRDFFHEVKSGLDLKLDYDNFLPIWNDIFFVSEENAKVYNLAKQLKKNYKILLLSNINTLHFDYLKINFPIFDAFHYILTSFEAGLRKPHPLIYQKALGMLETLPQETFYTDDRAELTAESQGLGIRSFVFTGISQLEKDLKACGVQTS